jgi:DUF4097 and DUF4098 domain-containing protein YvlB
MHKWSWIPVLSLLVFTVGCDLEGLGPSDRFKEDFHFTYPLKAGGRIVLENFNGSVEVTGQDGETVDISGSKFAATEDLLKAVRIDIVPAADSIRIRTVRPSDRRGNMGARYVLRVPRKTELERIDSSNGSIHVTGIDGATRLKTSNGRVEVTDLRGALEARTSNGSVQLNNLEGAASVETSNGKVEAERVRGGFTATTSNGSIRAHLEKSDPRRAVKLDTSNGSVVLTMDAVDQNEVHVSTSNASVTVKLPSAVSARVKASTSNGSVSTDFDVRDGSRGKTHLEGIIGSGGPVLDISTSNGSVKIERTI